MPDVQTTSQNNLEADLAALRSNGATEKDIALYRKNWAVAYGSPSATNLDGSPQPPSFSDLSDLQVEPDDINPLAALGTALSGAVKSVGGLMSAPLAMDELQTRLITRWYGGDQNEVPNWSSFIRMPFDETGEAIKAWTNANTDTSLGLRFVENTAENVSAGGIMVKGMSKWGQKLLGAMPAEVNAMQQMAISAAKNPARMQAFEALINTGSSVSGQTVYEIMKANGVPEDEAMWWKLGVEVTSGFGLSNTQRFAARIKDMASSKLTLTEAQRTKMAERAVGKFFDEVMSADPQTAQKFLAAKKIDEIYRDLTKDESGLGLSTAQVTRQNAVAAAEDTLRRSKPKYSVEYSEHQRQQELKTQRFIESIKPKAAEPIDIWQARVRDSIEAQKISLQREIDDAVKDAELEGITLLETGDAVALGNLGRNKLNTLVEQSEKKADELYKVVENVEIPTNFLRPAWRKSQASLLEGGEGGGTPSRLRELYDANFGKVGKTTVGRLREFQKIINEEIRVAEGGKRSDLVRRLEIISGGISSQLKAAETATDSSLSKSAQALKTANTFYKEMSDTFRTGETRVLLAEDLQGLSVVRPEDFIGRFIRSNKEKGSFEVAKEYRRVFGEDETAKDMIRQAYLIDIRNTPGMVDPSTGIISTKRLEKYLQDHRANLNAHGLYEDFDNLGSTAKKAADIQATNSVRIKDIEMAQAQRGLGKNDNLKEYVRKAIAPDAGRGKGYTPGLGFLNGMPEASARGYKQAVWEVLLESTDSGKRIGTGDTATLVHDPAKLRGLLDKNEKMLKKTLGVEHYNNLRALQEMMETVKPVPRAGVEAPPEARPYKGDKQLVGKILSRLRAAYVFQSRELTAVQILNLASDSMSWKAAEGIMDRALRDPEYARVLASASRNKQEVHALRSIYSAAIAPVAGLSENMRKEREKETTKWPQD